MEYFWIILTFAAEIPLAFFFFYWGTHIDSYVRASPRGYCAATLRRFCVDCAIIYPISSCSLSEVGTVWVGESSTYHWLAWHFLASNIVFACFYYVLAWDPHGTIAPGWTTDLG